MVERSTDEILGPNGVLARALPTFEVRQAQIAMARQIHSALEEGGTAVVEAGTGTGKTFGYLVPTLLCGKKSVISTGTKNLQEQIFLKDLPTLEKALGMQVDALMMKGRKNYLCVYRFHHFTIQKGLFASGHEHLKTRLENWLRKSEFADRAELKWMADNDPLWDALSCTSEQCLGAHCPFLEECFHARLRQRAARADLIIVNHHLFFADLKVKQGGFGEIIPRFQVAVFDEAHHMEEVATAYFGESLSTAQVTDLLGDLDKESAKFPKAEKKLLRKPVTGLRSAVQSLAEALSARGQRALLEDSDLSALAADPGRQLGRDLDLIRRWCEKRTPERAGLLPLAVRAQELKRVLDAILTNKGNDWVYWVERRPRRVVLHASPLDVSEPLRTTLFDKVYTSVLTSATLSTRGTFDYLRARLGLPENAVTHLYPSHFDYGRQSLLYLPKDLPPPGDTGFAAAAAERIRQILETTRGRALVLFTSHQNLNLAHQLLQDRLPFTLLKQGEAPRSVLLERFREDVPSVLLATGSFWQGVDVPGEALSAVIVDKLPFESPGEPLVAARITAVRAKGGNPFLDFQVPAAIIALRQGLGRLIRKNSDRGILAVLDVRVTRSRYGRLFLESLPPIPVTHDLADLVQFFEGKEGESRDRQTVGNPRQPE